MGLKLTIDIGNSSAKMALWDGDVIVRQARVADIGCGDIAGFLHEGERLEGVIFSSVCGGSHQTDLEKTFDTLPSGCLAKGFHIVTLTSRTPLPIGIGYSTPETLGHDRVAAVAGASVIVPGKAALVVDIGTAVTYDFLSSEGCFEGGNIAPGIDLRLKSLHAYTSLPEVCADGSTRLVGKTTAEAMRSGAVLGLVAEIDYYRSRLEAESPDLTTIITGGGSKTIAPFADPSFIIEPDLVMIGLKRILDYNESL